MKRQWIINPSIDMVSVLEQYGRFLETDYRMCIEHLEIPHTFEEYTENTGRKFMIIGSREAPGLLAKSVFLCLKLAGPSSVAVKVPSLDESFLVQNVLEHHAGDISYKIFVAHNDELKLSNEWREELENSTDLIVFGDQNAMETFREYETVDRHVWEHGYKFSFGILRAEYLTPSMINEMCFDFFSYYGEGILAPKFYFIVGKLTRSTVKLISATMSNMYGDSITSYRNKLSFTQKSSLISDLAKFKHIAKYIRIESLKSKSLRDTLYGDIRLVVVDDLEEISDFIKKWNENISTVAINYDDDMETLDLLEDMMVLRICSVGNMQFPDFFEQYDTVDDFNVYTNDTGEF